MTRAITEPKPRKYRLKSMVLARMLAEATVLITLVLLPVILALTGYLATASITIKVVVFSLCIVAALILPAYAFITWRVKVDGVGITTMSLAKHEQCQWSKIKRISRRSNWNWVRYVVEHEGGELSFPVWLVNVDELLDLIRQRLPKGAGGAANPFRKFSQDKISLLFQCMQSALGVGLVVIFWFFFGELSQSKTTSQTDLAIVFGFCLVITAIFLWRTIVVFLMPRSIEITPSGIIVDTMLFSRRISWQSVLRVGPSYPLLPEGYMLNTERGSFLIGNGMDSADELISSLKGRIENAELIATARSTGSTPSNKGQIDFKPEGKRTITADSSLETEEKQASEPGDMEESKLEAPSPDPHSDGETEVVTGEESIDANSKNPGKIKTGKKADRRFRRKKNKPS